MLNYNLHKEAVLGLSRGEMQQYASENGLNYNSLRGRKSEWKRTLNIPKSLYVVREKPLHLPHTNFVYCSDLHIPFHSELMLERLIRVRDRCYSHIDDLVIGGDFWDMGAPSTHPHDGPGASLEAELHKGGEVLRELMKHFPRIWLTQGNHEARFAKKLNTPFDARFIISGAIGATKSNSEIFVSNYDWMSAGGRDYEEASWLMGHPSNFGSRGGQAPADIAEVKMKNVLSAHNHICGMQFTRSGKYVGIDPGCMTRTDQHWYKVRRMNKFPEWKNGFVVVDNGIPQCYFDGIVAWSK